MIFLHGRRLALISSALAALMLSGVPAAFAQDNIFQFLFGNRQQRQQQVQPMPADEPRRQPESVPKVRGPQYHEYRTDALVRIDFEAIAAARAETREDQAALRIDGSSVGSVPDGTLVAQTRLEAGSDSGIGDARRDLPAADADELSGTLSETAGRRGGEDADGLEMLSGALEGAGTGASASLVPDDAAPLREAREGETARLGDEMLTALEAEEVRAEEEIARAVKSHYSQTSDAVWISGDGPNARARTALGILADADSHGLEPGDYAVSRPGPDASDIALGRFEMELSARVLRYVRDANSGRVDPNRISGYHDFERDELDLAAMLARLAGGADVSRLLESQHPRNDYYTALRTELSALRARSKDEVVIAPDTLVRPGQTDPEFSKILKLIADKADEELLAEFGGLLAEKAGTSSYSQDLVPVIRAAQEAAGVGVDGVIGPRTILAIAGDSRAARIEKVTVAMEQLRWLPSDLGERYVFLNAPAFEAAYFEDGEQELSMKAIYGKSSTQTYFFQDEISYVEFHPYWGMPRSILVNTYLPRLYDDPSYFDRNGYEVTDRNGRRVSSASVDWWRYGANPPFDVRQKPGGGNALGELKIMFPNEHAIYMHDTPERHLFDRENRAISNGCIRLEDPRAMAAAVLGWDRDRVAGRLNGQHGRENLPRKLPVYVAYFTAWPDQAGEVNYFTDAYDRDRRTMAALEKIENLRAPSG